MDLNSHANILYIQVFQKGVINKRGDYLVRETKEICFSPKSPMFSSEETRITGMHI